MNPYPIRQPDEKILSYIYTDGRICDTQGELEYQLYRDGTLFRGRKKIGFVMENGNFYTTGGVLKCIVHKDGRIDDENHQFQAYIENYREFRKSFYVISVPTNESRPKDHLGIWVALLLLAVGMTVFSVFDYQLLTFWQFWLPFMEVLCAVIGIGLIGASFTHNTRKAVHVLEVCVLLLVGGLTFLDLYMDVSFAQYLTSGMNLIPFALSLALLLSGAVSFFHVRKEEKED